MKQPSSNPNNVSPHANSLPTADERGWRAYRPVLLSLYDVWVHGVSNHWLWRCPTRELKQLYAENLGSRHMDIGVGTGSLLAQSLKHKSIQELTLVDANPICLDWTERAVQRHFKGAIEKRRVDFLGSTSQPGDAQHDDSAKFDSIALVYLLHCMSGQEAKRNAIRYTAAQLSKTGCCFGATLLGMPEQGNFAARRLQRHYRKVGIFANAEDSQQQIEDWLRSEFARVETRVVGLALLFRAWHH